MHVFTNPVTSNDGTKWWASDKANHSCENTHCTYICHSSKQLNFLISKVLATCNHLQCCF